MSRWFRFYEEALNDPKVQRLDGETFKAWVNLLCLASKNDGVISSVEDAAFALRMGDDACRTVFERLLNVGLIDRRSGGLNGVHYAPHGWDIRQFKSDTSTDRVKRFREKQRNVSETPPDTDTDTDKTPPLSPQGEGHGLFQDQILEEPKAPAIDIEAKFEEFRKAYPLREGTNPRKPAWEKFQRLVKAGQDPDAIIAGAKAYCAQQVALGKAGTGYIKQAQFWLNQECWRDDYPMPRSAAQHAPVAQRSLPESQWSTYLDRFKNGLPWPDFCGPTPCQVGCRAPPDLLKKFGFEPKDEIRH